MARVLMVDDDLSHRESLNEVLRRHGYDADFVATADDVTSLVRSGRFDAAVLALDAQARGLELLEQIHRHPDPPPIVVLASEGGQPASPLVQRVAYECLYEPFDAERVELSLRRAVDSREASRTLREIASRRAQRYDLRNLVGGSAVQREIRARVHSLLDSRESVLLQGETGTGKESVARAIHYGSQQRERLFVAVNITALMARGLLEAELFGTLREPGKPWSARSPGRLELARRGTLFLDEVGDLPLELQGKLLRSLQQNRFESAREALGPPLGARVIAASHRPLLRMVRAGTFREDLFVWLRGTELRLAPLRQRIEDLPQLVEQLLERINGETHKRVTRVAPEALAALQAYRWPGNVRELESALLRAVMVTKGEVIEAATLPIDRGFLPLLEADGARDDSAIIASLRDVERQHIARALAHTRWNKRLTCELLAISRPTLDRKIGEYSLMRHA